MTLAIDEEPPFMKLLAVMDRLDLNRFATIIMYSGGAGVRLATSSRFLRSRLYCNKELWKRVYFQSFLNGYHRIKEWDFVYCCARNYFDINSIPMESDALLCDVDWYDVYRQRIITEQNWRRDRFNEVTAHLPENAKIVLLKPPKECATILPYYTEIYNYNERKKKYVYAFIETATFMADFQDSNLDKTKKLNLSQISGYINIDTFDYNFNEKQYPNLHISDRFIIILSQFQRSTAVNVYTRKDYKLRYTIYIPFGASCIAINGQWALFKLPSRIQTMTEFAVLNMEKKQIFFIALAGELNIACIYEATCTSVIIYTAKIIDTYQGMIEWNLHIILQSNKPKILKTGVVNMECILNHIDAVSYEFPHIEIAADVLHSPILEEDRQVYQQKKQTFIHTILLTKNWNIKLERILKLSDQVIHLSSKHGNQKRPTIDYELLVQRGDGLVFNNAIDWSIVEKYDHVIGDLFFVCAKEDDGSLTYILLDMKASELLQEFHDRNDDNFKFSMNTSIIYRKDKSLITLMNHSAL